MPDEGDCGDGPGRGNGRDEALKGINPSVLVEGEIGDIGTGSEIHAQAPDLRNSIAAGINIVHINTELRIAWRRGLEVGLAKRPNDIVPYKILPAAVESVKEVVSSRLKLFSEGVRSNGKQAR